MLADKLCAPLAAVAGQPARHDLGYARAGVVNLFLFSDPPRGWRQVRVSQQRTQIDWARGSKDQVDIHFLPTERIMRVMDQLNTHSPASLHDFPLAEAKRLADKLEIYSTSGTTVS